MSRVKITVPVSAKAVPNGKKSGSKRLTTCKQGGIDLRNQPEQHEASHGSRNLRYRPEQVREKASVGVDANGVVVVDREGHQNPSVQSRRQVNT